MAKRPAALKAVGTELLASGFAKCLCFDRHQRHALAEKVTFLDKNWSLLHMNQRKDSDQTYTNCSLCALNDRCGVSERSIERRRGTVKKVLCSSSKVLFVTDRSQ